MLQARELKYAHITRRGKVDGKKRILTIVKMKESGKKSVYVAFDSLAFRFPRYE
jgi:hypothetical protein